MKRNIENSKFYVISVDLFGHEYKSPVAWPLDKARRMANLNRENMWDQGLRMCLSDVKLEIAQ